MYYTHISLITKLWYACYATYILLLPASKLIKHGLLSDHVKRITFLSMIEGEVTHTQSTSNNFCSRYCVCNLWIKLCIELWDWWYTRCTSEFCFQTDSVMKNACAVISKCERASSKSWQEHRKGCWRPSKVRVNVLNFFINYPARKSACNQHLIKKFQLLRILFHMLKSKRKNLLWGNL